MMDNDLLVPKEITPQIAIEKLRQLCERKNSWNSGNGEGIDQDHDHREGDAILCAVLRHLGQTELADLWNEASEVWWWS